MAARPSSMYGASSSSSGNTALQTRINQKRMELENLRQLRDLSSDLASQMSQLEAKLATLRDGTEAVACVLANWDGVLRAIGMAARKVPLPPQPSDPGDEADRGRRNGDEKENGDAKDHREGRLPETLVRIPIHRSQSQTQAQTRVDSNGRKG